MKGAVPKIVLLGGGTGSFTLLTGLKKLDADITAVVNMSDDGGSTGVLRDELGVLPPGDARQCLVALSDSPALRDLFNYRFDSGAQKGHSVGNIIISALEKQHGSFEAAIRIASDILAIKGTVLPVTLQKHDLILDDGEIIRGQHKIDGRKFVTANPTVRLEPNSPINPAAARAILEADLVIIAPGSVYSSLLPLCAVDGIKSLIHETSASVVCISNLVTKPGQTDGWHVANQVDKIEEYLGKGSVDIVLYNNQRISNYLLKRYAAEGEYPLDTDADQFMRITAEPIGLPLLAKEIAVQDAADRTVRRTLIRHDPQRVAKAIQELLIRS